MVRLSTSLLENASFCPCGELYLHLPLYCVKLYFNSITFSCLMLDTSRESIAGGRGEGAVLMGHEYSIPGLLSSRQGSGVRGWGWQGQGVFNDRQSSGWKSVDRSVDSLHEAAMEMLGHGRPLNPNRIRSSRL
jgi:hypothetical protein